MNQAKRRKLEFAKQSCFGKIQYHNEQMANEVFMKMKKKINLDVYLCSFCNKYHIGNKKKKRNEIIP